MMIVLKIVFKIEPPIINEYPRFKYGVINSTLTIHEYDISRATIRKESL